MKESTEVQKLIETMSQQTGTSRSSPTQVSVNSVNYRRKDHFRAQNSVFSNDSAKSNNFSPTSFNHDGFSPGAQNAQNSSILSEGAKLVNEATKIGATKIVNSMLRRTDTVRLKDSKWRKKLKKIGETLNKNKESVRQAHSSISLNFNGLNGNQENGNRLSLNNAQYQSINNQVNSGQTSTSHVNNKSSNNNLANNSIIRNNSTNSNFGSTGKLPSRENSTFNRHSSARDMSNPVLPSKPSLPPKTVKQINTN
jgi:hypothetical protein